MNQVKGIEIQIGLQLELAVNINEVLLSIVLTNEGNEGKLLMSVGGKLTKLLQTFSHVIHS